MLNKFKNRIFFTSGGDWKLVTATVVWPVVRKDSIFNWKSDVYQQVSQLILGPFLHVWVFSFIHYWFISCTQSLKWTILLHQTSFTTATFLACRHRAVSIRCVDYPNPNPYGRIRLLAASLRRPVFLLEFNHGYKESLVPYSRELSFTYLPGKSYLYLFINCWIFF